MSDGETRVPGFKIPASRHATTVKPIASTNRLASIPAGVENFERRGGLEFHQGRISERVG